MGQTRADPRGPLRTVASADFTPQGYVVRFVECDHVARKNATMTVRAGEQVRCFACGPCAPEGCSQCGRAHAVDHSGRCEPCRERIAEAAEDV